jgi:ectoine hydroxylase-related dioxygenase (phytanoyl-CoA dioxygenase family)
MPSEFPPIDFDGFHREDLPRRIAEGATGNAAAGAHDLSPLGLRVENEEMIYTYLPREGKIEIAQGDDRAGLVVELKRSGWEGLVHDLESPASLLYHREVRALRGDLMEFIRWEASLRALYTGRPVYDAEAVDLRDSVGNPLDPARAFQLGDDAAEMKHFLNEAGYLFVKNAFTREELDGFHAGAATLRERATPDDQKSWWVKNRQGENVLCRTLQAGIMPQFSGLTTDPRILDLVTLAPVKMVALDADEIDAVSILWKLPEIEEGLADLPWHRDCGMGGHASMCPTLVCSIFLGPNTPEAGELRFLPGSWRSTFRVGEATGENALHGIQIPAQPGDLTLHYGDGWHAAPPPTGKSGPFRSCILVSFQRDGAYNHRGKRHYNDVLLGEDEGQVANVNQVADAHPVADANPVADAQKNHRRS